MADYGKLNYSVSLKPTSAFPLDARCYFESLAEAQAAASKAEEVGSTNTIYYYGQKLVVVADGIATWYTIQPDKTLKADGVGDIESVENAEKLGGQPPEYYAKKSELSDFAPIEHPHEISEVNGLQDELDDMVSVAQGKCESYVFETVKELDTWLTKTENTANLKKGDVFLIVAVDVPDYWWDGTAKQILETTKVDLTDYAKKDEIPTVPTKVSAFTNDKNYVSQENLNNRLQTFALGMVKPSDVVDNLDSESGTDPLSARQGNALRIMINEAVGKIPTRLSQLSEDTTHRVVTDSEKATWNAKSDFSGKYDDLSGIPRVTLQGRPAIAGYYLLGTLPKKTDSGNYASFILNGRFGGWEVGNSSYMQIMLLNRNGVSGTVSMSYTASDINQIWSVFDIVISEDTETEIASIYLKCTNYFLYDFEWLTFNGTYLYTGTPVTEEPTNIVWQLSTAPKTMLSSSGVFTASGGIDYNILFNKPTIPSAYTHPSTHPASMITGLSKVATTNNFYDLDNRPTILSASNKGYNGAITAGGDGVAEMGKYIDFHNTADGTTDYSTRFVCTGEHKNTVNLPSASGTLVVGNRALLVNITNSAPSTNDTSIMTIVI